MLYFNTHFMTTKHLLYDWGNNNFIKYNIMGLYAVLMHRHMQITCISIFMSEISMASLLINPWVVLRLITLVPCTLLFGQLMNSFSLVVNSELMRD